MIIMNIGILLSLFPNVIFGWSFSSSLLPFNNKKNFDYDLVVIGAGASGLFAAGTASSLGFKTLLIERDGTSTTDEEYVVGGDCTNAACVPSKALRSIARMAATSSLQYNDNNDSQTAELSQNNLSDKWWKLARQHIHDSVSNVRSRESPSNMTERNTMLDLEFVKECHFIDPHHMELNIINDPESTPSLTKNLKDSNIREISGKKFIIATGASPVMPEKFIQAANNANIPHFTYRSVLRPSLSNLFHTNNTAASSHYKNIVLVGGGATACELGQAICRLRKGDNHLPYQNVTIVAPSIIPTEDISLQDSAIKLLKNDGCNLVLGSRMNDIVVDNQGDAKVMILDSNNKTNNKMSVPVDCLIFCMGRSPKYSLADLQLQNANVAWTDESGVTVNSHLQSKTARHVFACGDCASAVPLRDRRAIHAGWTGFHAVRNAMSPLFFFKSSAIHPFVPRIIYTDPELASVGMSVKECIQKYGLDGFDRLHVKEKGNSDRADVESLERFLDSNFVELRAEKITGKILGASVCGPAASEIINEVGLALVNQLTVRDMARTLHSYPSHGYLLYRIAMALATQDISGLLSSCDTKVGHILSSNLRLLGRIKMKASRLWKNRKGALKAQQKWEADGCSKTLITLSTSDTCDGTTDISLLSFIDAYKNETIRDQIFMQYYEQDSNPKIMEIIHGKQEFVTWMEEKPNVLF